MATEDGPDSGSRSIDEWVDLLLAHAKSGRAALSPGAADASALDPAEADNWPQERQLPADALRQALLKLQRDPSLADPHGLQVVGVDVQGRLDLENLHVTAPLELVRCRLDFGVDLGGAHLPHLSIEGSHVASESGAPSINALGATIGGQLNLQGTTLVNEPGQALILDGAQIGGVALLNDGFTAMGEVRAIGATIGGQLNLQGATLRADKRGQALSLDGAHIGGDAFLNAGFTATGEVRAVGASIDGQLDLRGAKLVNTGGCALILGRAQIGGNALLGAGFTATGEVDAVGATIGGQISLRGATVDAKGGVALDLSEAHVSNATFLDQGFTATGEVRAHSANLRGQLNLQGATLVNTDGFALNLEQAHIGGDANLNAGFTAIGEVRALGASIDGQLDLRGAKLASDHGQALVLDNAQISNATFLDQGFTATGEVRAHSAGFGGQLNLGQAILLNPGGQALTLDRAHLQGSAYLTHGFTAIGEVRALGASIDGQLSLHGASLTNKQGNALALDDSRISSMSIHQCEFRGRLVLAACKIGTLVVRQKADSPHWGNLIADGWQVRSLHGPMATSSALAQSWLDTSPTDRGYTPQPARVIADVYDRSGHPDLARRLRYTAACKVAKSAPRRSKPLHTAYGLLVGHGYYPLRTLWWLLGLFVLAGFLTTWQAAVFTPTDPAEAVQAAAVAQSIAENEVGQLTGATPCHELGTYPCFVPWSYALQTVVPPASAVQATAWQPNGGLLAVITLLRAIGWLLVALLLAGVTGLLRRA